jgi:PAS domain S-box-containing protein
VSQSSFFIPDHQKTGQIAKELDWAHHPLGPVEQWPLCLQLTLSTVFNTRQAVSLFWGDESYYFYNDAYIPILGEAKHLFAMGRPGKEVWGEVWDILEPQIKQIMKTGKATWFEDQYLAVIREGKSPGAYFTYSYSPVIHDKGVVQGTLVICVETTDRVQSALELQNSLQRFRALSDSLPQLVWTAEKNGDWNYMNRQWLEYTAVPLKFQVGRQWLNLIHPDDQFKVERSWQQTVAEKKTFDLEFRLLSADGVYRWFPGIAVLQEELWVGSCTDIEVTKQAQIAFEKNVDLSPAILWITEADGFCSYLSK